MFLVRFISVPGRYSLTGARNLAALSASEAAASQDSRLGESVRRRLERGVHPDGERHHAEGDAAVKVAG
jgi:hypothetical protein